MRDKVQFEIVSGCEEKEHFHQDIEILYLLEGSIELNINDEKWILSKGDIFLINANKVHTIKVKEEILLCKIYIDYFTISKALKKDNIIFWCNTLVENDKEYDKLKYLINSILKEYVSKKEKNSFLQKSLKYSFLEMLSTEFLVRAGNERVDSDVEKITQIIHYVNINYNKSISLSEMATKLYMSDSSFSRFFKKMWE